MNDENTKVNFFSHPVTFLFTNVVFPLFALGALGYVHWITTEALTPELRMKLVWAVGIAAALPALAAVRLLCCRRRIGWWWLVALALAFVGFAYFAFSTMGEASGKVDDWILSMTPFLSFWIGVVPPIFAGVARLATIERKGPFGADLALSAGLMVGGPILVYFIFGIFVLHCPPGIRSLTAYAMSVGLVLGGLALFTGLCRVVWLLGSRSWGAQEGTKHIVGTLVFCLALPLAGLALNLHIPFPADFANPWPWALSILTTLLMFPQVRPSRWGLALWWGRFTVAPFVFYFFLLFVPFLPLAVLAIIAMGAGFLILAPTLLFRHYTSEMYGAWKVLRTRYSKRRLILLAALGALVLPVGFAVDVEIERVGLKAILKWQTEEDFDAPSAPLPVPERRARQIVENANDFAEGAEIPFLSAWRTFRVYDGMYMVDSLREELNLRILGKKLSKDESDWGRRRNFFGAEMFGGSAGRSSNRNMTSRWTTRPPQTKEFTATCASKDSGEYLLKIHAKKDPSAKGWGVQEFVAPFTLPAGTWIEGMRLKMDDGTWKDAKASERKAAEFVYRHITEQRRDPSIITLDTPTSGTLKIFPVGEKGRDIEITLRTTALAPLLEPVVIGEQSVRAFFVWGGLVAELVTAKDAAVTLVSAAWMDAHTNELVEAVACCDVHGFSLDSPTFKSDLRRHVRMWRRNQQESGQGVMPSFEFTYGTRETSTATSLVDLPSDYRLPKAFLTALRRELPGVKAFDDRPLDGWYILETEDGGKVSVPYRKGEGALVFAKVKGAMVDDGKWSEGAKLWARENEAFLKPALDLRQELLDGTRRTGVLTTQSAYIAVETSAQEKALRQKEQEALYGDKALDFEEPQPVHGDAPGMLMLLVGLLAVLGLGRFRKCF